MNKKERYVILDALEGVCAANVNGDFPGAEASSVIKSLCSLFDEDTLLDCIDSQYHDALWAYGGLTQRAADACLRCDGAGEVAFIPGQVVTCGICGGTGKRR